MEGKSRFTPKQINKALRILRELPVKDGRKSIQEALRLLEQGMRDALEKGYSRGEIREKIAEAEVIISATTLKGFLVNEQKDAGQQQDDAAASVPEKTGQKHEGTVAGKVKNAGRKQREEMAGIGQSGGMEMQGGLESASGDAVNVGVVSWPEPDEKMAAETEHSSRKQHEAVDGDSTKSGPKQHDALAGKVSPGSIIIKPDTPLEDL